MQNIKISELKKHPRNEEFFDDMEGDKWESFLDSVRTRKIIEPIVVTQDLVIVSGHQRVRACEALGIETIPCKITHYKDYDEELHRTKDDMILEDLISTNIFQRGIGNVNPMKMALCILELERIKGIKKGNNQHSLQHNVTSTSQADMAKELHMTRQQLQRYKKLLNLIPELQDMVKQNELSATVGYKIWARMPQEEQEKFFNDIGREKIKDLSQKATQQYIDKIRNLEKELENEKNKEPIVKEKIVDNTDYETINRMKNIIKIKEDEINKIKQQKRRVEDRLMDYKADSEEYQQLKDDITVLTEKKTSLGRQLQGVQQTTELMYDVDKLLKLIAPTKYSQVIFAVKDDEVVMENLNTMIELVRQWCDEMQNLISPYNNVDSNKIIRTDFTVA